MKKIYVLLLFIFMSFTAIAQIEWVFENSSSHNFLHKFLKTQKNQYVIIHGDYENCCSYQLTIVDSIGNTLHNFSPINIIDTIGFVDAFVNIVEMPDSTISILASNWIVDMNNNGFSYSSILKFDANWEPSLIARTNFGFNYGFARYDMGVSLSDSSYCILHNSSSDKQIWRYDFHGNLIWMNGLNTDFQTLSDLAVNSSDTIFVSTQTGLWLLDKEGNIITHYPSLVFNQIKTDSQDRIIGALNNFLYLVNTDYTVIATLGLQGGTIQDFSVKDDTIAVLTSSQHVYLCDGNLNPIQDFQLSNSADYRKIAIGNGKLVLSGMERYGSLAKNEGTTTVFVKEYTMDGADNGLSKDVGVTSVSQPQEITVIPVGNNFRVTLKGIKVAVTNFGNSPVESLYLRNNNSQSKKFNNLGLGPGEVVELLVDSLVKTYTTYPTSVLLNLCYWTSHPNLLMDADAGNDSFCSEIISSDQHIYLQNDWKLFPNPTHDLVKIQCKDYGPLSPTLCRITDSAGKVKDQKTIDFQQNEVSFAVGGWPPAIYFVQLFHQGGASFLGTFLVVR